jgi:hypothetical protein
VLGSTHLSVEQPEQRARGGWLVAKIKYHHWLAACEPVRFAGEVAGIASIASACRLAHDLLHSWLSRVRSPKLRRSIVLLVEQITAGNA